MVKGLTKEISFSVEKENSGLTKGLLQVVASQDWPEITKYAGLVSAQAHRQELIQDLFKVWQDPPHGTIAGGMIRCVLTIP